MSSNSVQAHRLAPLSPTVSARPHSPTTLTLLSFAAIYFIWGSTFFAIRIAVGSIPALLVPAMRHLSVGLVFYPLFRFLSKEKPTPAQWLTCAITGFLLLTIGNGSVSWAKTFVPSGPGGAFSGDGSPVDGSARLAASWRHTAIPTGLCGHRSGFCGIAAAP